MTPRTSTYLRRLMPATRLAAAGAIAAGAMMLTAPAGNAIPESTIRSDCDKANNGTYTTLLGSDGKRYSKCCYLDYYGKKYCDNYIDGTYTGETASFELPPQTPPPPPPGEVVGPPATAATPAPPAPPDFGGPSMTLWMPPPPGPVAPPPSEATLAP